MKKNMLTLLGWNLLRNSRNSHCGVRYSTEYTRSNEYDDGILSEIVDCVEPL